MLLFVSLAAVGRADDRWIAVEGVNNFRDAGGYQVGTTATVAWGLIYRSGTLNYATATGVNTIRSLGIVHIVDLRTTTTVAAYPDPPLFDEFSTHTYLPVVFGDYLWMLHTYSDHWGRFFEILANPDNLPVDYHCLAGKDRTGILTALLLTHLGVDRETVIQDFLLSNDAYGTTVVWRSWLEPVLDEIESFGGPDGYLESIGVDVTTRQAVRANLLVRKSARASHRWNLYE